MSSTESTLPVAIDRWPCPAAGWSGLRALVVGAGESGLAMAHWLMQQGAQVRIIDSRSQAHASVPEGVDLRLGVAAPFAVDHLEGCGLLALSPGLTPHADRGSPLTDLLSQAEGAGIPVVGELDLFDWALSHLTKMGSGGEAPMSLALHGQKVLAVTGTNGKTTTARLTAHLLRHAGLDVQEAGNQGPALLQGFLERQASGRWPDVWVLELSSFQLALAHRFGCTAATVLNLTQDHQDWHRGMEDYQAAKLRIFGIPQAVALPVIDRDDRALAEAIEKPTGAAAGESAPAPSGRRRPRLAEVPRPIAFGLSEPPSQGPAFGVVYQGIDWLAYQSAAEAGGLQRLMPVGALKIQGRHNLRNAMAALGLALTVSDDLAGMLHALRRYTGEPHRMQWVTEIEGVSFVNDSKATNVGATVAALAGTEGPVIVILGGQGKGQNFESLISALVARKASVVGIGAEGPNLVETARLAGLRAVGSSDLDAAVEQAWEWARADQSGTGQRVMVLLSPACASLDMFKNYADRGNQFMALAQSRAQREGQLC
ncbi:MAG: Mur ligase family protein [Burkholderiaceae bacterium]